jgi:glycosyltransferase involved in cell wall biosynthesis
MEPVKRKSIVFIDFISAGHHDTYLKGFIRSIADREIDITIFYPDKKGMSEWIEADLEKSVANIAVEQIPEMEIDDKNRFAVLRRWMLTERLIQKKKLEPDLVFFAWVDDFRFRKDHFMLDRLFLEWIDWMFPYKWSGLYFHPVHLRLPEELVTSFRGYDIDDVFKLKNCISVCLLDKKIQDRLSSKIHKPVIAFPDFTDDAIDHSSPLAAKLIKFAGGRKVILLIGALMKRKGLLTFLEAAKRSVEKPWLFVLAGKIFTESFSQEELHLIENYITDPQPNVIFLREHILEKDFNALVNSCDILYAAYFDFPHTSNMLNKASIFHKPLIVSKGFYMDEVVTELKIGEVIDPANPDEAKTAICRILETENYVNEEKLKGFENYRRENSAGKLTGSFAEVFLAAGIN